MPVRIAFVGGGTVGHIAPSLSVWQEIKKMQKDAQPLFVIGTRPEEKHMIAKQKVPYEILDAPRLSVLYPIKFFSAVKKAKRFLRRNKIDVVFSKGGYVSVPVCYAAKKMRIPIVLHESDAVGGRANRMIATWAKVRCAGFPTEDSNVSVTGNPVRTSVLNGSNTEGLRLSGFTGKKPVLLVMGGSQGALSINQVIQKLLPNLLELVDIIHITGFKKETVLQKVKGYFSLPYAEEELKHLYAASTLVLSRAGAGSISELAAYGLPIILVPLEGVAHDHQSKNAQALEEKNAAVVVRQNALEKSLVPTINSLLQKKEKMASLSKNVKNFYHPDAARQIGTLLLSCLDKKQGDL